MRIRTVTAVAAAALSLAAMALVVQPWQSASAQSDLADAVKKRQAAMKQMGGSSKALNEFFKEGKGTAAEAAEKAQVIVETAKVIPSVFPAGTSSDQMATVGKTRAKPEIWSNWAGFEAAAAKLGEEAAKLEALLKAGDKEAAAAQFGVVGKEGCGGCHSTFRGPEV